jgi:hypothetical protein
MECSKSISLYKIFVIFPKRDCCQLFLSIVVDFVATDRGEPSCI